MGSGSGSWDLEIWDLGSSGSLAHELDRIGWGEALLSCAVGGMLATAATTSLASRTLLVSPVHQASGVWLMSQMGSDEMRPGFYGSGDIRDLGISGFWGSEGSRISDLGRWIQGSMISVR